MSPSKPSSLAVAIQPLLSFFDEAPSESRGHATALASLIGEDLGAGLLLHYFDGLGHPAETLPGPVTTGNRKGPRLGRWVVVREAAGRQLLQVEIKNSSAHAI